MEMERLTILYTGRVQGVGFRWTALQTLRGLAVTGYVRNLPDGRVEMVLEGQPADNERAIQRVRRTLGGLIWAEDTKTGPATGEFDDFGIRR